MFRVSGVSLTLAMLYYTKVLQIGQAGLRDPREGPKTP
jgi:hypothetical protein